MKQAPVVQRIGLWSTKPGIEVRILSGAQMEQWQMWSLQRTENPKELDRNQPAPLHGDDSSVGQNAGLWIRRSRVRSPFFTQTTEAWVSGRNHLSAKEAVLRGSKVRIFPFPQCPDGEVANTSVCKTDIRRFESCSRLEHHGSVAQR